MVYILNIIFIIWLIIMIGLPIFLLSGLLSLIFWDAKYVDYGCEIILLLADKMKN